MFVGYSFISKACNMHNKSTKVIEESIHVVFDETSNGLTSKSSFNRFN